MLKRTCCLFLAGGLYALGLPGKMITVPLPLGILGMALFLGYLSCSRKSNEIPSLKSELGAWALFSLGYCTVGLHWIAHTLHDLYKVPYPWNFFLLGPYSLTAFPHYLLFILLFRVLRGWGALSLKMNLSQKNILLAMGLTGLECYCPQLFPFHLGHAWWSAAPHLGLVPVGGLPLYSFFSYWMALTFPAWWRGERDRFAWATIGIFVLINVAIPLKPIGGERTIRTRLVQAGIGNDLKIKAKLGNLPSQNAIYRELYSLSAMPSSGPLDLIVWPETSIPTRIGPRTPGIVERTIAGTGTPLVTGGYNRVRSPTSPFPVLYNSLFFYDSQSRLQGLYRKQRLVPLVEYLPFGSWNKYVRPYIDFTFFKRGVDYPLFQTESNVRFFGVICYEILFSDYLRTYLRAQTRSPHFVINLSNDSWYGDSSQPFQHKFLAHWRALEFGIPVVRANNTGISSVLYPDGSESDQMKFSQKGYLDVDVKVRERTPTIFEKYGPWVTWSLGCILFLGASLRRQRIKRCSRHALT